MTPAPTTPPRTGADPGVRRAKRDEVVSAPAPSATTAIGPDGTGTLFELSLVTLTGLADGHRARGAGLLGLGEHAVLGIPVDEGHRMGPVALNDELNRMKTAGRRPIAIVATAGTTDFGSVDPPLRITEIASAHGVWLHVDDEEGGYPSLLGRSLRTTRRADAFTVAVALRRRLPAEGRAVVGRAAVAAVASGTDGSGTVRLKLTLLNPATTPTDIDTMPAAVTAAGEEVTC